MFLYELNQESRKQKLKVIFTKLMLLFRFILEFKSSFFFCLFTDTVVDLIDLIMFNHTFG